MVVCICIFIGWSSLLPFSRVSIPLQKSFLQQATPSQASSQSLTTEIIKVIDGDTVITKEGQYVRYIGINAPEIGQPFASDAAAFNKQLILGKEVKISFDVQKKDRYGRLMGYIFVGNMLVNTEIVRNGLALSEVLAPNTRYQKEILQAEQLAKSRCLGIWQQYCSFGINSCIKIKTIHFDAAEDDTSNLNDDCILL